MFSLAKSQGDYMQEIVLTFKIDKAKALPIQKLSKAMLALNESLAGFVAKDKGLGEVELELSGVDKGSEIFYLLVAIPTLLPIKECVDSINSYFQLWQNIRALKNHNIKDIQENEHINKTSIKNIEDILKLHQAGASNIQITNNFNKEHITINNQTILELKEGIHIAKSIKCLDTQKQIKYICENMMIEFYQTTNTHKEVKHKAFCYELDNHAKGIIISDENLKQEMLENPYNYRFLVDLEVYKDADGKILNYRTFNYKDKLEKD